MPHSPAGLAEALRASRRDLVVAAVVLFCISIGLYMDSYGSRIDQYLLGSIAWCFLACLLRDEDREVRVQVLVAILAATLCEYTFAPAYHIYIYRFDNVPAYVPPGHGLVYLAAVALARSVFMQRYGRTLAALALVLGSLWALWGISFADRPDLGGAVFFLVFAVFYVFGWSRPLYVAAFFVTSYLELAGTYWGTWVWATHWPSWGGLPQANPPSGIAAGYCFLDTVALAGAYVYIQWQAIARALLRPLVPLRARSRQATL
ncbi:MAG: hypothetical protein ACREWG_13150 [Gammaproteobacteria bacterium]